MTSSPTVQMDVQRLYEDLRDLLYEPFRNAFLTQERRGNTRPSEAIEAATQHLLFELPETRREIQKAVDEHTTHDRVPRSRIYNVYAPELLKQLVLDISREAWSCRYDGRVQIELKIQESEVSLHQIQHPDAPIHPPP